MATSQSANIGIAALKKQAERGDAHAQYGLAEAYFDGRGIAKSYSQAAFWYTKSADQGLGAAQYKLGYLLYAGEGVPKDTEKAISLYRSAAEQGIAWAQYALGNLYASSDDIARDYAEAYLWLDLAAAGRVNGIKGVDIEDYRDAVASHLSPGIIGQLKARISIEKEKIAQRIIHNGGPFVLHVTSVRSISPEKRLGFTKSLGVYAIDAYSSVKIGDWESGAFTAYTLYCVNAFPSVGSLYTSTDENVGNDYSFFHLWPVEKRSIGLNEGGRMYRVIHMQDVISGKYPDLSCDVYSAQAAR